MKTSRELFMPDNKQTAAKLLLKIYNEYVSGERELDKTIIRYMAKNNIDITKLDVSKITDFSELFDGIISFNQDISGWDVSNVTTMTYLFKNCEAFNQDINNWNVSNVKNMRGIFFGCTSYNQPLNKWDVSKVENMGNMFYKAFNFNQPLDNWNTQNVIKINAMFGEAQSFNQNICGKFVTTVKEVFDENGIFIGNSVSHYNSWDVSKVTDMSELFENARSFNQPIGGSGENKGWDVSNVEYMGWMFFSAKEFNQDIGSWNVSKVSDAYYMFTHADNFKQYLGDWKFNEYCNSLTINDMSFDEYNKKHEFTEDRLNLFINKYNMLKDDKSKYELIKYCKNYEELKPDEFLLIISAIKDNIQIEVQL
jgi:surface protein